MGSFAREASKARTMTQPESVSADVQRWLAAIGVESLCEWDTGTADHNLSRQGRVPGGIR